MVEKGLKKNMVSLRDAYINLFTALAAVLPISVAIPTLRLFPPFLCPLS